jgi:hypothetical protein
MMAWPSIQKNKASNSTGLRGAGVCQSVGATLGVSQQHNLMSIGASHNDHWDRDGLSFGSWSLSSNNQASNTDKKAGDKSG